VTQTPQTSKPSPLDQSTAEIGAVLVLGEGGGLGAALLRRLKTSGQPASSALDLTDGAASETDSLLHLGRICDAHKLAAETLQRAIEAGASPLE
jgi:hypothetical protein